MTVRGSGGRGRLGAKGGEACWRDHWPPNAQSQQPPPAGGHSDCHLLQNARFTGVAGSASPVFFDHIHKVGISFLPDVLEPQWQQSRLIQAHACPPSLLLQHFIQRCLAVAQLLLLWRAQKAILGLWAAASRALVQSKQKQRHKEADQGYTRGPSSTVQQHKFS